MMEEVFLKVTVAVAISKRKSNKRKRQRLFSSARSSEIEQVIFCFYIQWNKTTPELNLTTTLQLIYFQSDHQKRSLDVIRKSDTHNSRIEKML
jgi:hypothetical protein